MMYFWWKCASKSTRKITILLWHPFMIFIVLRFHLFYFMVNFHFLLGLNVAITSYLYLTAEFDCKNSSSWKSLVSYCCPKWQLYFFLSFHYSDSFCQNFITLWREFTVSRQKGFTSSNSSIDLRSLGIFHDVKHIQHYNFIKNNFLFCYS